jgi:hypothetical protein
MRLHLRTLSTWDHQPALPSEIADVWLTIDEQGVRVRMDAPFAGDPVPPAPPGRLHGLWEFEVVELMIAGADDHYVELECGPAGHWLFLQLAGVRNIVNAQAPIECSTRHSGDRWSASVWLPNALLPSPPWRVNAFAIHGQGSARRYLAWRPAGGDRPDFHVLDVFESVTDR